MNENDDLVSVIIPTYNRAQYLKRALESVIKQTHKNLEIIIIDDNSTDDTYTLVNHFIENDNRIILLRNDKNQGYSFGRASGMEASKGAFIAFLDDDEEWVVNKIECQLKEARKINTPALIICNGYDYVRTEEFSMDLKMPDGFIRFRDNEIPLGRALPNPSHWFFSRAVFEATGNYDTSFRSWADSDYLLRIFLNKIPIYFFNQLLVKRYRIENEGHVSKVGEPWINSKEKFLKKHFNVIRRDHHFLFRFYYTLGKDCIRINNKNKARSYFLKGLALKPYKLDLALKALKTF